MHDAPLGPKRAVIASCSSSHGIVVSASPHMNSTSTGPAATSAYAALNASSHMGMCRRVLRYDVTDFRKSHMKRWDIFWLYASYCGNLSGSGTSRLKSSRLEMARLAQLPQTKCRARHEALATRHSPQNRVRMQLKTQKAQGVRSCCRSPAGETRSSFATRAGKRRANSTQMIPPMLNPSSPICSPPGFAPTAAAMASSCSM
mmetsp:Transcript_124930/g.353617  ORF Transcript_124930/g.353617 Transcript_124930/m.353617 type:complete len:202 (+) Transcript_124930:272-877(+)